MRKIATLVCLSVIVALSVTSVCSSALAGETSPVLIVYNSSWTGDNDGDGTQDSLQVANYYAAKRGVPAANILGVACTTGVSTLYSAHDKFYSEMVTPIKAKLGDLGATNINIILLCYGVPMRTVQSSGGGICLDNALMGINYITEANNIGRRTNPYFETTPSFNSDKGHFSHSSYKFYGTEMYMVARVDGKTSQAPYSSMSLIDQAFYGERYIHGDSGYYKGNAYVDCRYGPFTDAGLAADPAVTSGSYGSYANADRNMAYAEHWFLGTGFPLKWETTGAEIGEQGAVYTDATPAMTAPNALFYGGWYNYMQYYDVWSWLPGSVACDLNSASLSTGGVRSGSGNSFGAAALERGATAVSGVIGEPYLSGHQRPNVLLYYIMQGYNFAEASTLSTPTIGWMPINVGDPLYTPMKSKTATLDTQNPALAAGFPRVSTNVDSGTRTVYLMVDQTSEPEVVKIELEYGFTASYGLKVGSGQGYWGSRAMVLTGLLGNSTYHYRLKLTDPVGNTTTTGDYTFTTGSVPNTAPTADDQTVVVEHDKSSPITLTASDPEGNALFYTVVSGPSSGTISAGSGAARSYTPNAGFSGTDTFTFKASDGALDSNVATVTVKVMPTEEVTLVLQDGLDGYAGTMDAEIYSSATSTNYGGATYIRTYHNGYRRLLVGFDLSGVPAGATISDAKLELYCYGYGYPSAGKSIPLYRVTRSWVEGTSNQDGCTYQEYDYTDHDASAGGDWTVAGGDYDATAAAEQNTDNVVPYNWLDWNIRDLTQAWADGTHANNGMLIRTISSSLAISYRSSEYTTDTTQRPKLTIKYFPAGVANQLPVAVADVSAPGYTVSVGTEVTLTGSASYDPDNSPSGGIQSYGWQQTLGPSVALDLTDDIHPVFTPSETGVYTFKLTVNDGAADSTDASSPNNTVTVTVETSVPTLLALIGDGTDATPEFSWTAVSGATKYEVWIWNTATGVNPEVNDNTLTGTSYTPGAGLTLGHKYGWVVRAYAGGKWGAWSVHKYFTVLPTAPTLLAPIGDGTDATPEFSWTAVSGATKYEVWIWNTATGVNPEVNDNTLTGTSYTPGAGLTLGHKYGWVVRAYAGGKWGAWSVHKYFTVLPE